MWTLIEFQKVLYIFNPGDTDIPTGEGIYNWGEFETEGEAWTALVERAKMLNYVMNYPEQ